MHDVTARTLGRIDRFIVEQLPRARHRDRAQLRLAAWEVPDEPVPFTEAIAASYAPFDVGSTYGKPWGTTWFHVTGTVPASWLEHDPDAVEVRLEVDLGYSDAMSGFQCEGAVWTPDGVLVKALHPRNRWAPASAPGTPIDCFIEAASNPVVPGANWITPTPMGDKATAGTDPIYRLTSADVVLADRTVEALERDVLALRALVDELPDSQPRRREILAAFEDMLDAIDPHDLAATAELGRQRLAGVLSSPAVASAHRAHAVGHAHIDSAWLWPVRETVRKCARTFGNVVALMDEHPDLTFACSSAQQYAWIKQFYPELFQRIRQKVASGQFVPVGGMWVESDTNMPGGEAMVRQFVTGTAFFRDEFDVESREVWLPDSFGYSAAMPQISRLAGKEFFLTQKMSWNDTNTFPHHTFWWQGIDGSQVFTHFPPSDTYNSEVSASDLHRAERQFAEKGRATQSLLPFGFGDGGGGPTREMVESARRYTDLEGSPRVELSTPERFFTGARDEYADRAPVWTGEMYLEYHRGTYTSQHRTKVGNRRSEHLLREAELWAATASVRTGAQYPAGRLDRLWKQVLLQQFHDILPGTSIAWVFHDAEAHYERVRVELEQIIAESLAVLVGPGERELVANARPFPDAGVAALAVGDPAASASEARVQARDGGFEFHNDHLRARLNRQGRFTSIVDLHADRELVPPGAELGTLLLCRDIPNEWDAWDINHFHQNNVVAIAPRTVEITGPATVTATFEHAGTTIVQTLRLLDSTSELDVVFDIDWHEQQQLLKWDLPLDVHADQAASEIQFGHVNRPTAVNTSWDAARFETVAHRWVHVAEPGFGVALTNSSTYGYAISRAARPGGGTTTTIRPSLLRGPMFPDPGADQGEHHLEFGLVVGAQISNAVEAGYARNLPQRTLRGDRDVEPLVQVGGRGVVVEAVKLAEDGSGDVVVRLYESLGGRATAEVRAGFAATEAVETDLHERPVGVPLGVQSSDADRYRLTFRPFQIRTVRFRRPREVPAE